MPTWRKTGGICSKGVTVRLSSPAGDGAEGEIQDYQTLPVITAGVDGR